MRMQGSQDTGTNWTCSAAVWVLAWDVMLMLIGWCYLVQLFGSIKLLHSWNFFLVQARTEKRDLRGSPAFWSHLPLPLCTALLCKWATRHLRPVSPPSYLTQKARCHAKTLAGQIPPHWDALRRA